MDLTTWAAGWGEIMDKLGCQVSFGLRRFDGKFVNNTSIDSHNDHRLYTENNLAVRTLMTPCGSAPLCMAFFIGYLDKKITTLKTIRTSICKRSLYFLEVHHKVITDELIIIQSSYIITKYSTNQQESNDITKPKKSTGEFVKMNQLSSLFVWVSRS